MRTGRKLCPGAAGAALLLCALSASSGCASGRTTKFLHPNVDLGAIRRVAVLPFENLTQERTAGEKVQRLFLTELLSSEAFEVVEPGQVAKELRASRVEQVEALGPADLKKLGDTLKVQGIFLGAVVDYAETRSGSTPAPEVTIQLRLVESQTGVTVWSVSRTRSGASASARLFGIGGQSLTEAARQLIRDELATLLK